MIAGCEAPTGPSDPIPQDPATETDPGTAPSMSINSLEPLLTYGAFTGTSWTDAKNKLPLEVPVLMGEGTRKLIPVSWEQGNFDSNTEKELLIKGKFDLSRFPDFSNSKGLKPEVVLAVVEDSIHTLRLLEHVGHFQFDCTKLENGEFITHREFYTFNRIERADNLGAGNGSHQLKGYLEKRVLSDGTEEIYGPDFPARMIYHDSTTYSASKWIVYGPFHPRENNMGSYIEIDRSALNCYHYELESADTPGVYMITGSIKSFYKNNYRDLTNPYNLKPVVRVTITE